MQFNLTFYFVGRDFNTADRQILKKTQYVGIWLDARVSNALLEVIQTHITPSKQDTRRDTLQVSTINKAYIGASFTSYIKPRMLSHRLTRQAT